jgi:hypothetical protein
MKKKSVNEHHLDFINSAVLVLEYKSDYSHQVIH